MKRNAEKDNLKKSLGTAFPNAVKENRRLIAAVIAIFALSISVAFTANQKGDNPVNRVVEDQTEPSREFMEEEAKAKRSQLEWTAFFIRNNLVSVIQNIGFGVVFGLYSIYALLMNGFMLGYTGSTSIYSAPEFLSLLLPHGVFELTGYLLAISCGVKLGIGSIKSIIEGKSKPLRRAGKSIKNLILPSILLIIIAGFIEAFLIVNKASILNSSHIQVGLIGASLASLSLILLWISENLPRTDAR